MLEYFTYKKAKKHVDTAKKSEEPVLNDADEAFLTHITSQADGLPPLPETPPELPARPQDLPVAGVTQGENAQLVLAKEAIATPLPDVPDTPEGVMAGIENEPLSANEQKARKRWSLWRRSSKGAAALGVQSVAERLKNPEQAAANDAAEAKKENEEITVALERLNLAAINNRVFSISDETRELLHKFTLVFKDLINGVPTAYDDLEALLTNSEQQLQKMFGGLPSFLQQLIEKLPSKFTSTLGPEVLAAAAEKRGLDGGFLSQGAAAASKAGVKVRIPSLRDLVTKQGALVSMLRTITTSLRTRFPAVLGMNVIWSLALSVLLLVCWYCHKRGKEVRLEKERAVTEAEIEAIKSQVEADPPAEYHGTLTTTAPEGASIAEVQAGIIEAQAAKTEDHEAQYAQGGSLGKALKEGEEQGEASSNTAAALP